MCRSNNLQMQICHKSFMEWNAVFSAVLFREHPLSGTLNCAWSSPFKWPMWEVLAGRGWAVQQGPFLQGSRASMLQGMETAFGVLARPRGIGTALLSVDSAAQWPRGPRKSRKKLPEPSLSQGFTRGSERSFQRAGQVFPRYVCVCLFTHCSAFTDLSFYFLNIPETGKPEDLCIC